MRVLFLFAIVFSITGCQEKQIQSNIATMLSDSNMDQTSKEIHTNTVVTMKDTLIDKSLLLGQIQAEKNELFVQLDDLHTQGSARGAYLRREAYLAFKKMYAAAKEAGHTLVIISATRNFDRQKQIWEAKWTGKQLVENGLDLSTLNSPLEKARIILKYSSMPGTSRHHWGTDIDINSLSNDYFETGKGRALYAWLQENAANFGFCQPYTDKTQTGRTGYEEEKWHWSYLPLSGPILQAYKQSISYEDLIGFQGAETAKSLDVIRIYVEGIDKACNPSLQD